LRAVFALMLILSFGCGEGLVEMDEAGRDFSTKGQGKEIGLRNAFVFQAIGAFKAKAFIKVGVSDKTDAFST